MVAIAVVAALSTLGAGVAVAVATDLVRRQEEVHREQAGTILDAPRPVGKTYLVAEGAGWELLGWRSDKGLCLDYATSDTYTSGCGAPIRTGPPPYDADANPAAVVAISGRLEGGGLLVAGFAQPVVARIELELVDGRAVPAELTDLPAELSSRLRAFVATSTSAAPEAPFPIRAIRAFDARGQLVERRRARRM